MKTMTTKELAVFVASYEEEGFSPSLADCLAAARDGTLWSIDTGRDGADSLMIADSAAEALDEVAEWHSHSDWCRMGGAEYAYSRRWDAERVTLAADTAAAAD